MFMKNKLLFSCNTQENDYHRNYFIIDFYLVVSTLELLPYLAVIFKAFKSITNRSRSDIDFFYRKINLTFPYVNT